MKLNPEQMRAAAHRHGPLLVLAGAGSGKTRVITERIAGMVDDGIPPEQILALTFTNKAAQEMRARVSLRTGKKSKGLFLSTFHSLGLSLIQEFARELGFSGRVSVLDESEHRTVIRRILARVRSPHFGADVDRVSASIAEARLEGLNSEILRNSEGDALADLGLLMERYQDEKAELAGVDFDDLIHLPVRLLREHDGPRSQLHKRWPYILVDEFQDTSKSQLELLRLLAGETANLCAVGDDDQSIYEWRGAAAENILHFDRNFQGCEVVTLDRNYRSRAGILSLANRVIAHNRQRKAKSLRAQRPGDARVDRYCFKDGDLEAEWVVQEIAREIRKGQAPEEVAILMRRNVQAAAFEAELARRRIPYRIVGGKRTADKKAARDLFAYLSITASGKNELAFRRAITSPPRGIGATSLDRIVAAAGSGGDLTRVKPAAIEGLSAKAGSALGVFQAEIIQTRRAITAPGARPGPIFREFLDRQGYRSRLEQELTNPKVLARQLGDLDRSLDLLEAAWSDPSLGGHPRQRLAAFVNRMMLAGAQDEAEERQEKVTLSTIHGVKGLEYDLVYVVGLEEGNLPTQSAVDEGKLEEERRLLYVAITRARDQLILTRSAQRRQGKRQVERIPSRFLLEAGGEDEYIDTALRRDDVEMKQDMSDLRKKLAALGVDMPEMDL